MPFKYGKIARATSIYRVDNGDSYYYNIEIDGVGTDMSFGGNLIPVNDQTEPVINEILALHKQIKPLQERINELEKSLPTLKKGIPK